MKLLTILTSVLIAGIVAVATLGLYSNHQLGDLLNGISDQDYPSVRAALEMEIAVKGQANDLATYVAGREERDLKAWQDGNVDFTRWLDEYTKLDCTAEEKALLAEIGNTHKEYVASAANVVELAKAGKFVEANKMSNEVLGKLEERMHECLTTLEDSNTRFITDKGTQADKAIARTTWLGWLLPLAVVGIGLYCAFTISRKLLSPIERAVQILAPASLEVAHAATQVSSTSQVLAEGASEQAASLEETSASLEEISSMTQQNTQNAQSAKEFTAQTRATAESGAKSTAEMGQAMAGIRSATNEMLEAMNSIKAASNDVSKIIKTIDEIAFQTNILALNAAVEAARAGEAGMGFAVVADEVRSLAQRSAHAAKETANMIEASIKRSDDGVRVTDKVVSSLEEVTIKAQQLEQKLAEIVAKVQKVDEQVAQIASASQEQSQGMREINMAISQMDKVTQGNASNAEESAAASEELTAQAEVLKETVQGLQQLIGGNKESVTSSGSTRGEPKVAHNKPQLQNGAAKKSPTSKLAVLKADQDILMPEPIGAGPAKPEFADF